MKEYEQFMEQHPDVKAWLKDRPENTKRIFARELRTFCDELAISPEEWRDLDKFKARDLAWKFISTKTASNPSVASTVMAALKSFYRNKNGEALPFDSTRGGKHALHVGLSTRGINEHIPNKTEAYQLIDMASSLRDKAILHFLFQTGVRVNVIQHLKLRDVADQLDKEVIALKVTGDLDHKLRSRDIPFYYTFLNGEGAETLKRYIALAHKQLKKDAPLFSTSGHEAISQSYVLRIVKNCCRKAGLNPETIWTHSIRKSFRKVVRQSDIDDDSKEQFMGHVLKGSRQAYFDGKDVEAMQKEYQRCNFSREIPKSEVSKLRQQLETEQSKTAMYEARLNSLETQFEATRKMLKELLDQKA
ncbi:tyrosine-type recombinase/integrase [Candidatus Bathyarchaeota archaeon]|nr:tyrosine-type recombinase/integrase [Candidatus Bathyarchaeota archaeon]